MSALFSTAHGDPRLLVGPMWSNWRVDPTVVIGLFVLVAGYVWLTGRAKNDPNGVVSWHVSSRQRVAFFGGVATLAVALLPPLEDWASLLLAGHMVQHLFLTVIAPPLLLIGAPSGVHSFVDRHRFIDFIGRNVSAPIPALLISSGVLIAWHVPNLYERSLTSEPVHVAQHLMFIASSFIAWLPVVNPVRNWPTISPLQKCLYLVATTLPGGIVGSFLTFAEPGVYAPYKDVPRMWGISLAQDQEAGGSLMWAGTSVAYLLILTVIFFRWAAREEAKERSPRAPSGIQSIDSHASGGE